MTTQAPTISAEDGVTCALAHVDGKLTASISHGRSRVLQMVMPGADRPTLESMIEAHRATFDDQWQPDPFGHWSCGTARFLAQTQELVVAPLIETLACFARVELRLDNHTLRRLPIETAHHRGERALFDLLPVYRAAPAARPFTDRRARRFRLQLHTSDPGVPLPALAAENATVAAIHGVDRTADHRERVLHVAGHDPTVPATFVTPDEQAHAVLSGCSSLPETLPAGVVSATGSLWPVDDLTNGSTMASFHSRLALGIGPLESLRQTQLLQRAQPPAVWAAYVHIGRPT